MKILKICVFALQIGHSVVNQWSQLFAMAIDVPWANAFQKIVYATESSIAQMAVMRVTIYVGRLGSVPRMSCAAKMDHAYN